MDDAFMTELAQAIVTHSPLPRFPSGITAEQACEETCGDQDGCGFQTSAPPTATCESTSTPGHD